MLGCGFVHQRAERRWLPAGGQPDYDGKIAVQGSATAALPTPCTSRWEVEGIVFAAIPLDGFTDQTDDHKRR